MLAALAVAIMVGAAYFFGIGLRADTAKSVAASPLGSSLTAVRESRLDDYYGRFTNSSVAASSASLVTLAKSRSDFYADLNNSAATARAASMAATTRLTDRYDRMNSPSAVDQYQFEWMGFTAPESVGTSSMSSAAANSASLAAAGESRSNVSAGLSNPEAARAASAAASRLEDYYFRMNKSSAAASTAALAPFYAGLDKGPRDQGIRSSAESSGGLVESSAADQDQFEWMGFTLPGSVEVKPSPPDQYHFQWRGLTVP